MIHGPDIDPVRDRAKAQVMRFFVDKAEADGTPATLRAMYVMKVAEAAKVLAGGTSTAIDQEAEVRGYTAFQMATIISYMADQSVQLELARIKVNVAIERAEDENEIVEILSKLDMIINIDLDP